MTVEVLPLVVVLEEIIDALTATENVKPEVDGTEKAGVTVTLLPPTEVMRRKVDGPFAPLRISTRSWTFGTGEGQAPAELVSTVPEASKLPVLT
jgi:hypothetical protein